MNHYSSVQRFMRCCMLLFVDVALESIRRIGSVDVWKLTKVNVCDEPLWDTQCMWNQAGLKVKPCCVCMKIHLRQSFAGTCLSQLVGAESFEATPVTLASVSLRFCVSEFCVRVISKKHCKLELRGGEAWNDEVALLVECLCWHGWLLLIVQLWRVIYVGTVGVERGGFQFMTVDLCWHGWCWTLWFFNWISRIFKPKPGPIVWANVSNEWCWLIVEICVRFAFGFTLLGFLFFLFPPCFTRHRSSIVFLIGGLSAWMAMFFANNILKHRDSLCQLVLHVYIKSIGTTWVYNYCKDSIYIHIHSTLYLHWWFWYWIARSPFGWHHSSSGTLLANESANSNLLSLLK